MRITTFFIFLLITSGILFTPLVQPAQEIELTPNEVKTVIITVRGIQLELETDISSGIEYNISIIEDDGSLRSLQTGLTILNEGVISTTGPGSYQLSLLGEDFGSVYIKQTGITTFQTIYFTILVVAFLYVFTKETGII